VLKIEMKLLRGEQRGERILHCVRVCVCVCVRVFVFLCLSWDMWCICVCVCVRVCKDGSEMFLRSVCVHVCCMRDMECVVFVHIIHSHTHIYTHMHTHIRAHMHTHIRAHIHTYICTYTRRDRLYTHTMYMSSYYISTWNIIHNLKQFK